MAVLSDLVQQVVVWRRQKPKRIRKTRRPMNQRDELQLRAQPLTKQKMRTALGPSSALMMEKRTRMKER